MIELRKHLLKNSIKKLCNRLHYSNITNNTTMEEKSFTYEIMAYLRSRGIRQKALAERLGVHHSTVSNIINGRSVVGKATAMQWHDILGIDPLWLMTQGEQGQNPNGQDEPTTAISKTNPDTIEIPILNLDSRGGLLPNDEADVMEFAVGTMPFNTSLAKAGDVVVTVYGDSMTPRYPAGSFILIRPIEMWREYIELGKSYVLELADWRRVIKIVRRGSDPTHYLLDSYNVDYESTEIAKSFISHVWLVVASVNREAM